LDRLQLFTRLETDRLTRRDIHFLARARIPTDTCFAWLHVENSEAAEFDAAAAAQGALHTFKNSFHGLFGLSARYVRAVYNRVHDVELDHARLPLKKRKPMLTLAFSLSRHSR